MAGGIEHGHSTAAVFERRRPLFWLSIAFCAGIACDNGLEPALASLGSFCLAVVLAACVFCSVSWKHLSGVKALLCGALAAFACGLCLHALNVRLPGGDDISRRTSAAPSFVWVRGTVVEAERERYPGGSLNWTLALAGLGTEAHTLTPASGRLRLAVARTDALAGIAEGDRVELRARVEAPPENTLPDSFDYAAFLAGQGIRRTGQAFPETVVRTGAPAWRRPDLILRRGSGILAARVESLLDPEGAAAAANASESTPRAAEMRPAAARAALLNALLFGRRERLDQTDRESFAISGTAHLLSISGLHIQFLTLMLFRLLAFVRIPRRRAAWLVLVFVCGYCALSGANAPVVRATVMIVLYLAALLWRREADALNVLGASALAILFAAPGELFNAGFQLSFLSVLSLLTLYPVFLEAWARSRALMPAAAPAPKSPALWLRAVKAVRESVLLSLAAWLGTAPVVAWHMGRFPTLSLLANLMAVPLNSIAMLLGLVMTGASLVCPGLAWVISFGAAAVLWLLQTITAAAAALPLASLDVPPPGLPVLLVFTGVLVWIWVVRSKIATAGRLALLIPASLAALNAGALFREPPAAPSVTLLALAHGRAALVETPDGRAALLDSGGEGQGARIAELLRRRGVTRLSLLVISADEREAIGGAAELLKRVPVARVVLPRSAIASTARREVERLLAERGISYGAAGTAETLQGPGDVRWEFWDDGRAPDVPAGAEAALTVRLSLPGTRLLFVPARSNAALSRLMSRAGSQSLQADIVCLSPGESARWPQEIAALVRQSGCRVLVAGSMADPEELPGLDLAALAQSENIRLLAPHRAGSLRFQADTGGGVAQTMQAYRNGKWQSAAR